MSKRRIAIMIEKNDVVVLAHVVNHDRLAVGHTFKGEHGGAYLTVQSNKTLPVGDLALIALTATGNGFVVNDVFDFTPCLPVSRETEITAVEG